MKLSLFASSRCKQTNSLCFSPCVLVLQLLAAIDADFGQFVRAWLKVIILSPQWCVEKHAVHHFTSVITYFLRIWGFFRSNADNQLFKTHAWTA